MNKKTCLLCLIMGLLTVGCTGQYYSNTETPITESEAKVIFEQLGSQAEQLSRIESELVTPIRITNVQGQSIEKSFNSKQSASDLIAVLPSVEDPEICLIIISNAISMEPGNVSFYDIYEKEYEKLYSPLEALDATVLLLTENLQYANDSELESMIKKAEEFNAEYNRISKKIYDDGQNNIQDMLNEIVLELKNHASDSSVEIDVILTLIDTFDEAFAMLAVPSDDLISISADIDSLVDIILEYIDITEFSDNTLTMTGEEFASSYMEVSDEVKSLLEDINVIKAKDADVEKLIEHFCTLIVDAVNKLETRYLNVDEAIQAKSIADINSINKILNTHKTFNLDKLTTQLDLLSDAFNGIRKFNPELKGDYADYMYLCSAYESYLNVCRLSGNASNMTDEDFFQYYINISVLIDNATSTILLRPQGMKNYGAVIENIFDYIKREQRKLYDRYEAIALGKVDELIQDYKMAGGKGAGLSRATAIISTLEINDNTEQENAKIKEVSMDIYKESFGNFQYEMGKQLAGIKNVVDAAKKSERLELLFKYGFFDIPYDDLIPELKFIYDSFDVQKAIDDSDKTFQDLLWKYPVVYHEVMDY